MENNDSNFVAHGSYTVSNAGGYLVELSDCGEMARMLDSYGSDNPKLSDWLPIEFVIDEDSKEDDDGIKDSMAVIDPDGYNIPLNQVMRLTCNPYL